ncbi:MAG: glycosyl transferase group 1 [Frankiales bacterium]|nr:glycosyl transferase group 1 [Frankiales bacterium]
MRVLWLTNMANPAPRAGGGIRSLRLVQATASRWPVDVINLGTGLDTERYVAVSGARSAAEALPDAPGRLQTLVTALRHQLPLPACRALNRGLRAEVQRAADLGDAIVIEHGWMLAYRPRGGRTIVALHNVDSELARMLPARGARRLERRWNASRYRRLERMAVNDPRTAVTVVSRRDAGLLGGRTTVVPNGTDLPDHVTAVPAQGDLIFVGSMGYPPNVDALSWWATEVWPGTGLPALRVIGQGSHDALGDLLTHPALDVIGEVPTIQPWLEKARAVVVPLRQGSGTRLKLLEAFAHHRPVVSTSKGAEGLDAEDGTHLLLADDAVAFAEAVRLLLADDVLAERLATAGSALAQRSGWGAVTRPFVDAIEKLVGAPDSSADGPRLAGQA